MPMHDSSTIVPSVGVFVRLLAAVGVVAVFQIVASTVVAMWHRWQVSRRPTPRGHIVVKGCTFDPSSGGVSLSGVTNTHVEFIDCTMTATRFEPDGD